ncbi:DNA-directed RNA polymerase I subunit RPA34 [Rhynchocyon petersi]
MLHDDVGRAHFGPLGNCSPGARKASAPVSRPRPLERSQEEATPLRLHVVGGGAQAAVAARSASGLGTEMADPESGGVARFSCPPNFAATPPASELPRLSLETLMGPDTELWLIRAPADFTPDCFNGRLVPLSGSQIVKGKLAGKRHRYRVLSSSSGLGLGEATLLVPSAEAEGELTCAPAPQGSLRIFEGPQKSFSGIPLQPIPASLPPQIPPGLRPRFCAFGGSPPVTGPGSDSSLKTPAPRKKKKKRKEPEPSAPWETVNGHVIQEVETALGSPEMVEKQQQLQEPEMMERLGTEVTADTPEALGLPSTPNTKKRKKKHLRGTEVGELFMGLPEPEGKLEELNLGVQTESLEEKVISPTKKRKKQKGGEGTRPVEGLRDTSPVQAKVKLQEEAIPLPSKKKKKKEKRQIVMTVELGADAQEEAVDPVLPGGPESQVAWACTKARKKEKGREVTVPEPGTTGETGSPGEMMQIQLQDKGAPQPEVAPGSTKKKKKERGLLVAAAEPGTEVTGASREMMQRQLQEGSQPQPEVAPVTTKKRRGPESEGLSQEPLLGEDTREVASGGQKKKRKKHQQQAAV